MVDSLHRRANDQRLATPTTFMDTKILKPAPLAYENEQFLKSPDGRVLRILSEYIEPLARFRREQIQDTVVFFGSARFQHQQVAGARLSEVQGNGGRVAALQQAADLKRAQAG